MPSFTLHAHAPTDVPTTFDYVADSSNTPKWFYGIKKFQPLTEQTRGLGATFETEVHMGATLKSTVECIEYVENEIFTIESTKGIQNKSRWTFSPAGDGGTEISCEFSYHLGSGIAGAALSRLVEPFVAITVKHTTNSLVAQLS